MKPDGALRHFLLAFVLAAVGYVLLFTVIERHRTSKGPWQVTFAVSGGVPVIQIDQPHLGLTNVQVVFAGHVVATSTSPVAIQFHSAQPVPFDVPYGRVIFLDTTFLPGTVTLQLFDHEIELLPRVLVLDHTEHPWQPGEIIEVSPAKPAPAAPSRSVTGKAGTSAAEP